LSKEDVIPRAIGGYYTSSQIACTKCNSDLGSDVDHYITDWLPCLIARDCFDLEGYKGSVPSYEVTTQDGQVLTVGRKGTLRPKWSSSVKWQKDSEFYFSARAPTEKEALGAMQGFVAKRTAEMGHPPRIVESRLNKRIQRDWQVYHSEVTYDYSKQGRAIAKMAFHYLATRLDHRFLLTRDFEPIIHFVRYGERSNHPALCQPATPIDMESVGEPSIQHTLTLRCSSKLRSAVCDVELFGILRWAVVLSYSYEGPDIFRTLVVHPLKRDYDEGPTADVYPLPASLILNASHEELTARYGRLEEAIHSLVDWLDLCGFSHHIRKTLLSAIAYANAELPPANSGMNTYLAAVADSFSDQSSPASLKHFLGKPSRLAAGILSTELLKHDTESSVSLDSLEEHFSRLIFIRLLVDALALVAAHGDLA
jgi:hypothetical protein